LHKTIVKRIRKIETRSYLPRWRVVVKDTDNLYRGECGEGLSEEQFKVWTKTQDSDSQIIIIEVEENGASSSPMQTTFRVENLADKNTNDFLKDYDELIKISRLPETEIIAKSVESQVSSVDSQLWKLYTRASSTNRSSPRNH